MFEYIFGNKNFEKILFFILINKECYATQLSKIFDSSVFGFQTAFERLEKGGLIVSQLKGKTRMYMFNPRYPFLPEITDLLSKSYNFLPIEIKEKYYEKSKRTRPRRKGKPIFNEPQ